MKQKFMFSLEKNTVNIILYNKLREVNDRKIIKKRASGYSYDDRWHIC